MRTKGDFRRCTTQNRARKEQIYALPYNEKDDAVTLEKDSSNGGTATVDNWSTTATNFVKTPCPMIAQTNTEWT
jgi:hypothetical protein